MVHLLICLILATPGDRMRTETREGIQLTTDLDESTSDELFQIARQTEAEGHRIADELSLKRRSKKGLALRVFSSEREFDDFLRRTRDAYLPVDDQGYYNANDNEVIVAWQRGSPEARGRIRREIGRHVVEQHTKNPAIWFVEGFSRYFEGLRIDRFGDPIGTVSSPYLEVIQNDLRDDKICPLETLFELRDVDYYGFAGARNSNWSRPTLYAESWALVFYLLTAREKEGVDEMRDAVIRQANGGSWKASSVRRELPSFEAGWREMLDPELDLDLPAKFIAEAWAAIEAKDYDTARMRASRALSFDEDARSPRRAHALASYFDNAYDTAAASYARLLEQTPNDLDALLGITRSYLQIAITRQTPEAIQTTIDAATRAAESAPSDEQHYGWILCADAAELGGNLSDALNYLRRAQRSSGLSSDQRSELKDREYDLIRRVADK